LKRGGKKVAREEKISQGAREDKGRAGGGEVSPLIRHSPREGVGHLERNKKIVHLGRRKREERKNKKETYEEGSRLAAKGVLLDTKS